MLGALFAVPSSGEGPDLPGPDLPRVADSPTDEEPIWFDEERHAYAYHQELARGRRIKEGKDMQGTVKMEVRPEEIIKAVKRMKKQEREAFLEDLLASTSPDYLESIREGRGQYKAKKVRTHAEVFGR